MKRFVVHGHSRLPRSAAHCMSRQEREWRRAESRARQEAHNEMRGGVASSL